MNILLTTEQILAESVRSTTTVELGNRLCRAQVRKVVEWMNSNGYVVIERAELNAAIEQALKAAVEGE